MKILDQMTIHYPAFHNDQTKLSQMHDQNFYLLQRKQLACFCWCQRLSRHPEITNLRLLLIFQRNQMQLYSFQNN